jgi:tetratricopeptide (TPR) repeat protein
VLARIALLGGGILAGLVIAEIGLRAWTAVPRLVSRGPAAPTGTEAGGRTLRVVGVGESTMLGEPYPLRCSILEVSADYLRPLLPGHDLKTSMVAGYGRTLHNLMPEVIRVIDEGASLVIAYAGHNDFIAEFRGDYACTEAVSRLHEALRFSLLFRTGFAVLQRHGIERAPLPTTRDLFDAPAACTRQWSDLLDRYRSDVLGLAERCARDGIPLVLVFPAGDEADFHPHRSVYRGPAQRREELRRLYLDGRSALAAGRPCAAQETFKRALEIDGRFAESWFWYGKASYARGRVAEARKAFHRAKEEDGFPWRALDAQRSALVEASRRYGAVFIDGEEVLRTVSPDGLLDSSVFSDIHHPNLTGHHALARSVVEAVVDHRLLPVERSQAPQFLSEEGFRSHYRLGSGDWFEVFLSRAEWFDRAWGTTFDPLDRLVWARDYLRGVRALDPGYFELHLDGAARTAGLEQRIREARSAWEEGGGEPAGVAAECAGEPLSREWRTHPAEVESVDARVEPSPVHISGVPSTIHHALGSCEDGRSLDNQPIRVGGRTYEIGFATHPLLTRPADVVFQLGGQYRSFTAAVAIADSGNEHSSVACRVLGDGVTLWESGVLRWRGAPVQLAVDVAGVDELRLTCDDAGNGYNSDHAMWLDPELAPSR